MLGEEKGGEEGEERGRREGRGRIEGEEGEGRRERGVVMHTFWDFSGLVFFFRGVETFSFF